MIYLIQRKAYSNADKMKRQRNMFQTEEQNKTPESRPNGTEITSLLNEDSIVTVIKMLIDLWKTIDDLRENFIREVDLKNSHTELKNSITEMKNTIEGINSRLLEVEERINEMEIKEQESNQAEIREEKALLNMRGCLEAVQQLQMKQYSHNRGLRRRKRGKNSF